MADAATAELWRRAVRLAGWFCVALLAVLSLLPAEEMVRTGIGGRIEHVLAYAGTALLLGLARRGSPPVSRPGTIRNSV